MAEEKKQSRRRVLHLRGLRQKWIFNTVNLGVVEAASSSLVTQTKIGGSIEPPIFFYFLANPREISHFRNKHNGLVLPYFEG